MFNHFTGIGRYAKQIPGFRTVPPRPILVSVQPDAFQMPSESPKDHPPRADPTTTIPATTASPIESYAALLTRCQNAAATIPGVRIASAIHYRGNHPQPPLTFRKIVRQVPQQPICPKLKTIWVGETVLSRPKVMSRKNMAVDMAGGRTDNFCRSQSEMSVRAFRRSGFSAASHFQFHTRT